jgi:putative ABC transport system permease protein
MKFLRIFKMAISTMKLNKTRTFLSTLGVVVGVASLILITSFGYGAQSEILSRIQALGSNVIIITPGTSGNLFRSAGAGSSAARKPLTYDDLTFLIGAIPGLQAAPQQRSNTTVDFGRNTVNVSIVGTNEDALTVNNYTLAQGRSFISSDIQGYRNVCILGSETATSLFGTENPIGQSLTLMGSKFTVIGTLQSSGSVGFQSVDTTALVPITTLQMITGQDSLEGIYAKAPTGMTPDTLSAIVTKLLTVRHGMENFTVSSQTQFVELATTTTNTLTIALTAIGLIALIVGGIGIMNIMLASVAERTREIGIRKAIGATRSSVLTQFLLESVIITLSGGTIGIIIGTVASLIAKRYYPTLVTPISILIGFAVSVIIGIFFGVYPANKASKLNPVEALRYE